MPGSGRGITQSVRQAEEREGRGEKREERAEMGVKRESGGQGASDDQGGGRRGVTETWFGAFPHLAADQFRDLQ